MSSEHSSSGMEGFIKFLFLMLLGGFIAVVGDRVGKYFGKRKLTIFHLRPRHTSMVFTFIYGMMISLVTAGLLAIISGNVRTALTGVSALERKGQKLERGIQQLTQNELTFHIDQPIAMEEIRGGASPAEIKTQLDKLLENANQTAINRYNEMGKPLDIPLVKPDTQLVVEDKADFTQAVQFLEKTPEDFVAIVNATQNAYLRGSVSVHVGFVRNKLVFHAGETIISMSINGTESSDQILVDLFGLLSDLQQSALKAGMIPNPITNDFGGNILVATLLDKRDQVKAIGGRAVVRVVANHNLYSVSPLDVNFRVESAKE